MKGSASISAAIEGFCRPQVVASAVLLKKSRTTFKEEEETREIGSERRSLEPGSDGSAMYVVARSAAYCTLCSCPLPQLSCVANDGELHAGRIDLASKGERTCWKPGPGEPRGAAAAPPAPQPSAPGRRRTDCPPDQATAALAAGSAPFSPLQSCAPAPTDASRCVLWWAATACRRPQHGASSQLLQQPAQIWLGLAHTLTALLLAQRGAAVQGGF